jgi:hypothetical protein
MPPAVFHECVDHRPIVAGVFRSEEESIFRSELEWTHGVLGDHSMMGIVIDLKTPVLKIPYQTCPMPEAIEGGFAHEARRAVLGLGYFHHFADAPDVGSTALGALRVTMGWCRARRAQLCFDAIQFSDKAEDLCRIWIGTGVENFHEVPADRWRSTCIRAMLFRCPERGIAREFRQPEGSLIRGFRL